MMKTTYDDKCKIHNTDHDKTVDGEVLEFQPQRRLVVSLERSVKITLAYDNKHHIYVGSMGGMEFTSEGPTAYHTKEGRS